MSDKQRTLGQFSTPPDIADLLLAFCLRRPGDKVLDPSCGAGAFLARAAQWLDWLADLPDDVPADALWGVELDEETALIAQTRLPQAHIRQQNFFIIQPDLEQAKFPDQFDAIIGNPPYTRAEWIGRLRRHTGQQLTFEWGETTSPRPDSQLIPASLWSRLSSRSGLHAYFFLHGVDFLREGGRFGFVVPNGWLDVAYGAALKQFLLDHFKIIAIIESTVERWFEGAKINTCLVVLEKCSGTNRRASNFVRLIRLKRPLSQFLTYPPDDYRRLQKTERLVTHLLPSHSQQIDDSAVRVLPQGELQPEAKWGLMLRAPDVYRQRLNDAQLGPLSSWAAVQRGYTTGANEFFYLDTAVIDKWGIEPEFRQIVLKSLRGIDQLRLTRNQCRYQLLTISAAVDLSGTAVANYITWGEEQGFHQRRTCASRHPWYSLLPQFPGQIVLPKGIWRRHSAPLLDDVLPVDQQLYQIRLADGVSPLAAAALLNSAWFMLQCELEGRINFGAGVLWLATYELQAMRLPDPRHLPSQSITYLEQAFTQLAARPCQDIETELNQPDRQHLDQLVFDMMNLTLHERTAVLDSLRDRVQTRRRRAAAP